MAYIATQRTGLTSPAHHKQRPNRIRRTMHNPAFYEWDPIRMVDRSGWIWETRKQQLPIYCSDCTRLSLRCTAAAFVFMHKIYLCILYKSIYTVYIMYNTEIKCCLPNKTINTRNLHCTIWNIMIKLSQLERILKMFKFNHKQVTTQMDELSIIKLKNNGMRCIKLSSFCFVMVSFARVPQLSRYLNVHHILAAPVFRLWPSNPSWDCRQEQEHTATTRPTRTLLCPETPDARLGWPNWRSSKISAIKQ